jgi:hypothetical protein
MALIIDPDDIQFELTSTGTKEMFVDLANKRIKLVRVGALSADGITLKAVYSKLKDIWQNDATAIKYAFPMTPITDEQYELLYGWDFDKTGSNSDYTPNLIRTGGWARKNVAGATIEQWVGVVTLGNIQTGGQVYYTQSATDTAHNFNLTGAVNQAVQVYNDADGDGVFSPTDPADYDYRSYMKLFIREQGNTYATSQLSDIGVTGNMSYQVYRFPLADADDSKIGVLDTGIDANADGTADVAPYTGMTITWYATAQARTINGTSRNFHVIIDGNQGTLQQIYEFVQWKLRQNADIDDGAGTKTGKLTNELLYFVGSDLFTRLDSTGGVYVDDYKASDTNLIHFTDDTGTIRNNARTASLRLDFGANLQSDSSAIYRVFFTNDDAGDNLGYDFGTANAITINDASSAAIAGSIGGLSFKEFTYDFDNNTQRGAASAGDDVPFTAVAIGLNTGQYVSATGTILGTTLSGSASLVAALERNYQP